MEVAAIIIVAIAFATVFFLAAAHSLIQAFRPLVALLSGRLAFLPRWGLRDQSESSGLVEEVPVPTEQNSLARRLHELSSAIEPIALNSAHPQELSDLPEFAGP